MNLSKSTYDDVIENVRNHPYSLALVYVSALGGDPDAREWEKQFNLHAPTMDGFDQS